MKAFLISLMCLISIYSFSQITFDKAYFIDNNGLKTECLIKNLDWVNNPVNFEFKLSADDSPKTMDISSVKEFGIYNFSRFVRADVKIDRSKTKLKDLSQDKEPEWSDEQIFLKILIEGKATLYYYQDFYHTRLFYSIDNSPITQLVYKEYYSTDGQLKANAKFRQQLWAYMRCNCITERSVEKMEYSRTDIEDYFKKYYECSKEANVNYEKTANRDKFDLRITPGLTYSTFNMVYINDWTSWEHDYGSQTNFRMGIEIDFILPFKKNKWVIVIEPTYQYFSESTGTIKLNFIEFPIGLRNNFFLNKDLRIHINAFIVPGICASLGSKINMVGWSKFDAPKIEPKYNWAFGAGIDYKKISAEVRYYTNRNVTVNQSWHPEYEKVSLILGYQLF
jgi:hypothetical protein